MLGRIYRRADIRLPPFAPWGSGSKVCSLLRMLYIWNASAHYVGAGSVVSYLDQCELEQDVALEAAILSTDEEWIE